MSVGRHRRISRLFRAVKKDTETICQVSSHLIGCGPNIETKVGCNLFVTAAAAVQLVAGIANEGDQLLLDEVVHIFRFLVLQERRR